MCVKAKPVGMQGRKATDLKRSPGCLNKPPGFYICTSEYTHVLRTLPGNSTTRTEQFSFSI